MAKPRNDLLRGTLDTLVLKTLSWKRLHGYGIARLLEEHTDDVLQIEEGSLYPALYRLETHGFIEAEWGTSELGRRAKFYSVTPAGKRRLHEQTERWSAFSSAVSSVLLAQEAKAQKAKAEN